MPAPSKPQAQTRDQAEPPPETNRYLELVRVSLSETRGKTRLCSVSFKFCKHCGTEHALTSEYWYFRSGGKYPQCKLRTIRKATEWQDSHRDTRKAYLAQYYAKNQEEAKRKAREYYAEHREAAVAQKVVYTRNRRANDPMFRVTLALRARLTTALRRGYKSGSAVRDLGCSIDEFRAYIESKFQPGMTWENHGRAGWHLDHIRPLAAFDLSDPDQLKQAVHFTNLQPLWALDNFRKGSK